MLTLLTTASGSKNQRFSSCLPEGVKLTSEIFDEFNGSPSPKGKPKTVASKLAELRARCKNRKLITRDGKEIRIVQLIGCWGNPPEDYQEQMNRQRRDIEELRKKYIVIQIPCTPNKTIASGEGSNMSYRSYRPYTTDSDYWPLTNQIERYPSICCFSKKPYYLNNFLTLFCGVDILRRTNWQSRRVRAVTPRWLWSIQSEEVLGQPAKRAAWGPASNSGLPTTEDAWLEARQWFKPASCQHVST